MDYNQLKSFLTEKMRMSHIYQPVMIKRLLQGGGQATDKEIALVLLSYDPSQLEYYRKITNDMVGKVLRAHKIVEKQRDTYRLVDFESLNELERKELSDLCDRKIHSYIKQRGDTIWAHRRNNRNNIPGSIRYEVLKRAQFRCELCGISHYERALEVDHIIPKSYRGEDSVNNYQALCYVCNASKNNRDSADFRGAHTEYEHRDDSCLFCQIGKDRIVLENSLAYVIWDKFPVTEGHGLIIPKRHFAEYFQITQPEVNSITNLLNLTKDNIKKKDSTVDGFNIGINSGESAGQTIMHVHVHLIPRRSGDVPNPRGGIRNVITGKGDYQLPV